MTDSPAANTAEEMHSAQKEHTYPPQRRIMIVHNSFKSSPHEARLQKQLKGPERHSQAHVYNNS